MIRLTLICGAALIGAAAASAGEIPVFADLDTNYDGVITLEEFVAYKTADGGKTEEQATESFHKIAGEDGVISVQEWTSAVMEYQSKKAGDNPDY